MDWLTGNDDEPIGKRPCQIRNKNTHQCVNIMTYNDAKKHENSKSSKEILNEIFKKQIMTKIKDNLQTMMENKL